MLIEYLGCFSNPEYDVKIEFRTSSGFLAGQFRTSAPSVQPPTPVGRPVVAARPSKVNVCLGAEEASVATSNALAAKQILPQNTLHDLLQEAILSQYCEAITAQGKKMCVWFF